MVPALGRKRILLIKDDIEFAKLEKTFLQKEVPSFDIEIANCGQSGLEKAIRGNFDCIISDYDMPELNGIEVFQELKKSDNWNQNTPFIIFTGKNREELADKVVSEGITDFLKKGGGSEQYRLLANKIQNYTSERIQSKDVNGELGSLGVETADEFEHAKLQRESEREIFIELYKLATDTDLNHNEKMERALFMGREYLGLEIGLITNTQNNTQLIEHSDSIDSVSGIDPGFECPLDDAYCKHTLFNEGLLALNDTRNSNLDDTAEIERFDIGAYIGERIIVEGEVYGTLCFLSSEKRERTFSKTEEAIVNLLTGWVSYEIEQRIFGERMKEQNKRLDRFASFVSHDLRNPLSVAKGYLELERKENDSENLAKVADAHERMETLIDQLLELSRGPDKLSEKRKLNLKDTAEDAWSNINSEDCKLDIQTDFTIDGDKQKLMNVLENIFKNSVNHNNQSVTIRVGEAENGFYIEDTGGGFDEPDKVFEDSYTTSENGNGLGLTIVKEIIKAHNWSIEATNGEFGARFEIRVSNQIKDSSDD